jgi:hypothetical protein
MAVKTLRNFFYLYIIFLVIVYRPYWRCYFPNTQAIIYVVDSSDTDRLVTAKEEFHSILEVCKVNESCYLYHIYMHFLPCTLVQRLRLSSQNKMFIYADCTILTQEL